MKIQFGALLLTLAVPLSTAATTTKKQNAAAAGKRLKRKSRTLQEPGPNVYLPRDRTGVTPPSFIDTDTFPPEETKPPVSGGDLPTAKLPVALPGTDDPLDSLMVCLDKCSSAYLGNSMDADSFCRYFGLEGDDFDVCANAVNGVDSSLYGTPTDVLNAWCEQSICADQAAAQSSSLGNRSFKPPAPTAAPVAGTITNRLPKPPVTTTTTTTDGTITETTNRNPTTTTPTDAVSDFKKCMRPCVRYVRQQAAGLNVKEFCTTFFGANGSATSADVKACVNKAKAINPLKFQVRGSLGGSWCRNVVCAEYI